MYGFRPFITCDDHLLIVGYDGSDKPYNNVYKIPVANITSPIDQNHSSDIPTKWTELTAVDHCFTVLVPSSSPPVIYIVGGWNYSDDTPTADVKVYNNSNKLWKKIGSLSSARSLIAVAAVYNNVIITIRGCTKGDNVSNRKPSSMTVVELGQAELLH